MIYFLHQVPRSNHESKARHDQTAMRNHIKHLLKMRSIVLGVAERHFLRLNALCAEIKTQRRVGG
jgi:hypothetical protein